MSDRSVLQVRNRLGRLLFEAFQQEDNGLYRYRLPGGGGYNLDLQTILHCAGDVAEYTASPRITGELEVAFRKAIRRDGGQVMPHACIDITHATITVYRDGAVCSRLYSGRKVLHAQYFRSWAHLLTAFKYLDIHSTPLYVRPTRVKEQA